MTDVTLGSSGNAERMAYLYDRRKVSFTGLAAELVLPKEKNATEEPVQMARSPYLAGFRAGWAYLTLATVHIYYGKGVAVDPRRLAEITAFSKTLAKHASKLSGAPQYAPDQKPVADNLIMLGVPAHYQTFVVGLVIVVGTSITSLKAKSSANRAKI